MPDDIEFSDLDTEDEIEENQTTELADGDAAFLDEEEIDVQVAPEGEKETKSEEPEEGKKKRLNRLERERRLVREERQRADAAEAEIHRLRAENAALASKGAAKEEGSDDDIDREIQAKTRRFREVVAEFDPDKAEEQAQLMREVAALEAQKALKKAQPAAGSGAVQPAAARPHRNVQAWLDKNDWFDDPQYGRETRRARAIDAQVYADGYRVEDDDYFEEVERRMEAAGIRIPGRKRSEGNGAGRKEGTVAGRVEAPTGGKVLLTPDDLATLRKLGQNVNDKKVLEEYARNKLREQQRA